MCGLDTKGCIKVVTGSSQAAIDGGYVTVYVDQGQNQGFQAATIKGKLYGTGATVLDVCYDDLKAVRVQITHSNGWIGSVTFARDKTGPYTTGSCPTCTGSGSTSLMLVDGNNNGKVYSTDCLDGKMCDITFPAAWATTDGKQRCNTARFLRRHRVACSPPAALTLSVSPPPFLCLGRGCHGHLERPDG